MDGNVIDVVCDKLRWLLDHPEVTWSGSGIYALSLTDSAVFAVAACVWRRKKKSSATNQFNSNGGEQNIGQGQNAIGKKVDNHGPVISTSSNQSPAIHGPNATVNYNNMPPEWSQYAEEFGVTKAAIASFFKILEQEKVPPGDLDSKLREIAFRYKELLLRFEAVTSDDPQVQALKEQAQQAFKNGEYDRADNLLDQIDERRNNAIHQLHKLQTDTAVRLEQEQLGKAENLVSRAKLQRLQYRYEKAAQYLQEAAAALPEGRKWERADYLGAAGNDFHCMPSYPDALRLFGGGSNPLIRHFLNIDRSQNNND